MYLDTSKQAWVKMPELMLTKCAEAAALRKGWPEDYSNLYAEEEVDKMRALDLTPAEWARQGVTDITARAYGVGTAIVWQWNPGDEMVGVPIEKWQDLVMDYVQKHEHEPSIILEMWERNKLGYAEFWKHDRSKAFETRDVINKIRDRVLGRTPMKDRTPPSSQAQTREPVKTVVTSSRELGIWPPEHG